MKKLILIVVLPVITVLSSGFVFGNTNKNENILLKGEISSISNGINVDTIEGNGWYFESEYKNQFVVGDKVIVEFDNMKTETIYDDEIVSVYKEVK